MQKSLGLVKNPRLFLLLNTKECDMINEYREAAKWTKDI